MYFKITNQLKRLCLISFVIIMTLGIFAALEHDMAYADGGHKTTLNVVGVPEDVSVQWYYTTNPDGNTTVWTNEYILGTALDLRISEYEVTKWTIETTELKKCGPLTGVSLSKTDGTVLQFIKAADKDKGIQSTDFPETSYNTNSNGHYYITSHPDDQVTAYTAVDAYGLQNMLADVTWSGRPTPKPDAEHSTISTNATVNDDFDHVITLYFYGAEDAPAIPEEVQAVIDKIKAIGEVTAENYLDKANLITAAKDAYDKLATDDLKALVTNHDTLTAAETAFDGFKLDAAKTAAISELEGAFDRSLYSGEELTKLNQAIEDGKTAINCATSEETVTIAKNDALEAARKAKTDAQIDEEALQKAKNDAKKEIDDKYDLTQYSGDEKAKLEKAIADAKSAIDAAESLEAVTLAKKNGIAEADKAKTVKQIADEKKAEIARKKAAAKKYTVKGLKVTSKNRKFTATWKKTAGATGYQVQYKLKSAKKYNTLKTLKKLKVTSKKLKKGKKYQFRVRTYTTVKGSKVYGKWTKVKTVKCNGRR